MWAAFAVGASVVLPSVVGVVPTRAIARTLVSPAPFPPLAGWAILTAGAVAPHRAFVKLGRNIVLRLARIPKVGVSLYLLSLSSLSLSLLLLLLLLLGVHVECS
jgi:hypothetical protein